MLALSANINKASYYMFCGGVKGMTKHNIRRSNATYVANRFKSVHVYYRNKICAAAGCLTLANSTASELASQPSSSIDLSRITKRHTTEYNSLLIRLCCRKQERMILKYGYKVEK